MTGSQHSEDYKISAVKHYLKHGNYVQTCEIFGCKRQSLQRWVEKYLEYKNLKRKKRYEEKTK